MGSGAPTLTLQDVADLARVRRPVVSMWRKRPRVRGELMPFPEPVEITEGVERFSRDDIVSWLQETGRGNNGEAHLDAPALSTPDGASLEDLVTLLCLAVTTIQELADTTAEDRANLAREADPRDQFLQREVIAMKPAATTLSFIDDLIEASFGPGEALERLEQSRVRRALGTRDLTTGALDVVRSVAEACASYLDVEGVPLVHGGTTTTLTLTLADYFAYLVVGGDGPEQRALRRRASIRGVETATDAKSPNIRVLSVVGSEFDEALDEIDNVVLELSERELAVVLGPASLLCDELRGEHEHDRSQTLRPGNLVVALRLLRGMCREAHRQALGLWVCSGRGSTQRPLVADLAAFTDDESDAGDLAADVVGALDDPGGRAFRYLRPHDLAQILSSSTPVVPRGVRAVRLATSDVKRHAERINAATLVTSAPIPPFDVLVAEAPGAMLVRRRSLGEMKGLGLVQVKRGSRIDPSYADDAGSVAVLSATGTDSIALDPFDAARYYSRAARTEPGDVVFTERPRPRALVDEHGSSLVASPSRILRVSPKAGVGPHAVAAIINRLPDDATEWQTWSVPTLDADQVEQLDEALIEAAAYESSLHEHLNAVHSAITAMIDGVATGAVTLTTPTDK